MKTLVGAGLLIWVVSLPLLSVHRVQTWGNEVSLWESAGWWAPAKIRPDAELGRLAHLDGRLYDAEAHYLAAIAHWKAGRPAHERAGCQIVVQNLAALYQQMGRFQLSDEWGRYRCDWPR